MSAAGKRGSKLVRLDPELHTLAEAITWLHTAAVDIAQGRRQPGLDGVRAAVTILWPLVADPAPKRTPKRR